MDPERLEEIRRHDRRDLLATASRDRHELLAEVDRLNGLVSDSFRIIEALHRKINQETT